MAVDVQRREFESPRMGDTRCDLIIERNPQVFSMEDDSIVFSLRALDKLKESSVIEEGALQLILTGVVKSEVSADFTIPQARKIHEALGELLEIHHQHDQLVAVLHEIAADAKVIVEGRGPAVPAAEQIVRRVDEVLLA